MIRTSMIYLLFAGATLVGCEGQSSKDLSRTVAKQKLLEAANFPWEMTVPFQEKIRVAAYDSDTGPLLGRLQGAGLVTVKQRSLGGGVFIDYEIRLTDKGAEYLPSPRTVEAAAKKAGNKGVGPLVTVCFLDFDEITGIQQNADKTEALVHFRLKAQKVNAFAMLATEKHPCRIAFNGKGEGADNNLIARTQTMALFDDGWRVKR